MRERMNISGGMAYQQARQKFRDKIDGDIDESLFELTFSYCVFTGNAEATVVVQHNTDSQECFGHPGI